MSLKTETMTAHNFVDLTGQRFGKLTVVARSKNNKRGQARWRCLCDCGNDTVVWSGNLRSGSTTSCGCLKPKLNDLTGKRFGKLVVVRRGKNAATSGNAMWHTRCDCGGKTFTPGNQLANGWVTSCGCTSTKNRKHGQSVKGKHGSSEYRAWSGLKQRCLNPKCREWHNYGGRGIKVHPRWTDPTNGFANFYADMGPKPSPKHSIERVNVNGDYSPDNCIWGTPRQQVDNRRAHITDANKWTVYEQARKFVIPDILDALYPASPGSQHQQQERMPATLACA